MAISMGGRPPSTMPLPSAPADQVTITPTEEGGFAVECLRDGRPTTSIFPDHASALDYVASELSGAVEPEMASDEPMGPPPGPPPLPEEMM